MRNSIIAAILLIFSVLVFGIVCPRAMGTWARRNLAFSEQLWPRLTRLELDGFPGGVRKVARGADVDIVVRADTAMPKVPQVVEIRYREEGGGSGRVAMNRVGIADPAKDRYQEFVCTRRNVLAPIRFNVYGGDAVIAGQRIEVVDNPTITLTADCEFPAYMDRPPRSLPATGVMPLPQGSRITIHANSNKELTRVQIDTLLDGQESPPATQLIEKNNLSADRRGFDYILPSLDKNTTLLITLFDSDGIKSREPVRLTLEAVADQAPQVVAQLEGLGMAITPQARAGIVGRVTDDYGIGKIWFEYALDQAKPETVTIHSPRQHSLEFVLDPRDAALEVRDLKLKPGQKLLLGVAAADLCSLAKGPNVGFSERWLLDVVTADQLQTLLKARELVLRQRFEALIKETGETRDLVARMEFSAADSPSESTAGEADKVQKGNKTAAGDKLKDADKAANPHLEPNDESNSDLSADAAARRLTLHILRVQRALTNSRKGAQEILGLAEAFADIYKQLDSNRIDNAELKQRLQLGIADPLRIIAEKMLPELERRLDNLQSCLEDVNRAPPARDNVLGQAGEVLTAMRRVLDRMIELQDYNEMVEMLRDIIKTQDQLRQQTDQRRKQMIREFMKE